MYSFEGQYRRVPQQNLSGASVHHKRDEILHKAHLDRMKREECRRREQCTTRIQAFSRSYLTRQKVKEIQRKEFDEYLEQIQKISPSGLNDKTYEHFLNNSTSKIVFFYDEKKDVKRLVSLSQKMILKPATVMTFTCNKVNHWNYKLKKLLLFHLRLLSSGNDSFTTHLRMIDMFTSEVQLARYIQQEKVLEFVYEILSYLLAHGYYKYFRCLVDDRIPPMIEPRSDPPTPFAASLIDLIQRPLKLAFEKHDSAYSNLCLEQFALIFLCQEFSEPLRFFVIPNLSVFDKFPYQILIEVLSKTPSLREDHLRNSWLLFSVVSLGKDQYLETCDEKQLHYYLSALSSVCHNFSKSGLCGMYGNDDSDSDSDEEMDLDPVISKLEIEVLEETAKILNKYNVVQTIISKTVQYQHSQYGESVIQSLSQICYHLLSAKKSGLHEYKLLCSLALTSQFLRQLWYIITHKEQEIMFGSAATYINMISRGMDLAPVDIQVIVPMITTFCSLLMLLITTLHDTEFYNDDPVSLRTSPMPFSLQEMAQISSVLKELCVGLIELAYPDSSPDFKSTFRHDVQNRLTKDPITMSMWPRLFKVAVALIRQLHSRDLRKQFCPDGMWVSTRISMMKFDKPPDIRSAIRRRHSRPFSGFTCYTREDLEKGPPLSTRELRTMTVIKEMPFLLPFQERVLVFQNHVLKDKLEHQGEAPYAVRGRSLDVTVRRNYLYEDAFDNLSPVNAPDLRYVMRIQLKNAVGVSEAGVDGGGLSREFLSELLKTAFDPNRGFFRLTNDNQLYPNPHVALLHPDFTKHYYFIGRILGKAMYENLLVELPLAEFFLSKLVSRHSDVSIHHLASLDPVMYKNLLFLKSYEGDVSDLGLDFTVVIDELGETKIQELKPNGAEIPVTNENKIEYIHLVADFKLNKQIAAQNTAFKNGLSDVIQPQWLHMFSNKELQILISGAEIPIDISDLKRHAKYSGGYHEDHPTIKYFWQAMEEFDDDQRRLLLKFVTSCSRQPLFGFKELDPPFCIQKGGSADRLPSASTCMNLLKMPEFDDYELLKNRVLYAIQAGAGFELS